MTHEPLHTQIDGEADEHRNAIGLPLASIIIVNYNYGHFLRAALDSVLSQTYPNIEVIIVDDASTDGSCAVLEEISLSWPAVKIIRLKENSGQSQASRIGFDASHGDYVTFLDADDVLLSNFVRTHIFVHLSLRVPVGLSSSDMGQALHTNMILSTTHHFSNYVTSKKGKKTDLIRPVSENGHELWPLPYDGSDIIDKIHFVPPNYRGPWMWAPTSGNCFRRDALAMFMNNNALENLRSCTDAYLVRAVALLTGSVLIDRALGIYRLHGTNSFSNSANLNMFLHYDRGASTDNDQKGRRMVIDHLVARADFFSHRMHSPFQLLGTLQALDRPWPRQKSRISGCHSYVGGEVIGHFTGLSKALGRWRLTLWASQLGIAPWTLLSAWLRAAAR